VHDRASPVVDETGSGDTIEESYMSTQLDVIDQ
jgi:hypothetical protein